MLNESDGVEDFDMGTDAEDSLNRTSIAAECAGWLARQVPHGPVPYFDLANLFEGAFETHGRSCESHFLLSVSRGY